MRREVMPPQLTPKWWFGLSFLFCIASGVGSAYVADVCHQADLKAATIHYPTSACGEFLKSMVLACSAE